ncbi:MAG: MFS transporter [Ruthenibacterium lactatiformans]
MGAKKRTRITPKLTHKHTLAASYLGYITQAVVNNLTPLLFVVFETSLGISIGRISLLITVNFGVQMLVDLLSAKWINVIGTRRAIVAAHAFAAAGLVALGVLPYRTADPYVGVLCAVCLCAVGGGITEVLISPIVEALPSEDKAGSMSLLHAFYCWGHVGWWCCQPCISRWRAPDAGRCCLCCGPCCRCATWCCSRGCRCASWRATSTTRHCAHC